MGFVQHIDELLDVLIDGTTIFASAGSAYQNLVGFLASVDFSLLFEWSVGAPMRLRLRSRLSSGLRPTVGAGVECSPFLFVGEVGLTEFLTTQGAYNGFRLRGSWQ